MNPENKEDNNLRALRKQKGLSLSDVSDKLKLTSETIRKLEKGDFKSLGAYTYVRGYLMNYTSLLGVDVDPYLKMVPQSDINVSLINTSSSVTKSIKLRRQSKNMASYVMGTFLVLVICFSGWYLLKNYSNITRNQNNDIEIVDQSELAIPINNSAGDFDSGQDQNQSTEESYHYSSLIPAKDESDVMQSESSDTLSDMTMPPQDEMLTTDNITPVDEPITEEVEPQALYQVIIEAKETSWVKVEKSDGSNLHNNLLKPGRVVLESDDTMHFRIGNKKQVTVTINGEIIDLSKYSRKDIADFKWPTEG